MKEDGIKQSLVSPELKRVKRIFVLSFITDIFECRVKMVKIFVYFDAIFGAKPIDIYTIMQYNMISTLQEV